MTERFIMAGSKKYPRNEETVFKLIPRYQRVLKKMTKDFEREVRSKGADRTTNVRDHYIEYVGVATNLSLSLALLLKLGQQKQSKSKRRIELKVSRAIQQELSEWVKERERSKRQWQRSMR